MDNASAVFLRKCRICHEYGHRADNRAFHPLEIDDANRVVASPAKRRRSKWVGGGAGPDSEDDADGVVKGRVCSLCNCYGHRADNKRFHPETAAFPVSDVRPPNIPMPAPPPFFSNHGTGCDPQLRCKNWPSGPSLSAVVQELLALQKPYLDENGVLMRQYEHIFILLPSEIALT
jgi:hypothetical protein